MEYLRKRALRFRKNGRLEGDELDSVLKDLAAEEESTKSSSRAGNEEEGTYNSGGAAVELTDEEVEALINEEAECVQEAIAKGLLQYHGTPPNAKKEGIFRLGGENGNGFNNNIKGNEKLEKAVELRKELELDVMLYAEHRLNLRHKDNKNDFRQMFQREDTVRAVGAHNRHENIGRVQEGGTAMVAFGETTTYIKRNIKDDTGLGRFTGMRYCGSNGHSTSIIVAYNPCKNKRVESNTSYQQHRRYFIEKKGDTTCPRTLFLRDLVAVLKKQRAAGDKLILFMDHNEHVYDGKLGKALSDPEGLAMQEAVQEFTGEKLGPTFFRGTRPIDGLWVTNDIDVSNVCVMPVGYGVGDHRMFIIDIPIASLVGENPIEVVHPAARRLNSRQPYVGGRYVDSFEDDIIQHRLLERLYDAHTNSSSVEEVLLKVEKIDAEGKDYMRHAEKICRKIKSCKIPYSPESSIWIRRTQVYHSLLRFHEGKIRNIGNLKRAARRCGIKQCTKLSVEQIFVKLKYCEEQCEYYKRHGRKYRYKHLNSRIEAAKRRGDDDAAQKIEAIIKREKERAFWRKLAFVTGKKRGKSVTSVQVDEGNGIFSEHTGQHEVEQAIFKAVHGERYQMAEESPICQGNLRDEFGYLADTPAAKAVLDGTYQCAPDTPQSIQDIFAEIARIRREIPAASINVTITPDQWVEYWKVQKEETSSSISGLHFGHYKVGATSSIISHYHAARVSVILAWGIALTRWSSGLTVMLEKILGCNLVTKLRAILLMEADFNATNKIIYGKRMLDKVRENDMMPEDTFSEKGKVPDDGTLGKTLFYDVTRQARIPAALASVDASNCYDRIAHAIASLVFQAFGVPVTAAKTMLGSIEEMKFFLRTGFGDSTNFSGGSVEVKTQGICQGNGGGPATWAVVSIVILNAHKRAGHGARFIVPITNFSHHLCSVLYVDDMDLLHINMEADKSAMDAHQAIQSSITNWGNLLIATGGALKPAKCFGYLISFVWKDGKWSYANNQIHADFGFKVPLPNGTTASITHHPVDHAEKTLGAMTAPDGNSVESIRMMQSKAQEWVNNIRNGMLNRGMVWFSLRVQFWPRVGYSICNSMASFAELAASLQSQYYQILPLGGVVRTAPSESRMIDSGFYGIGLPHPGVEALIGMSNKLLMHYGCKTAVGLLLRTSLDLLTLEVGMSFQVLQLNYRKYSAFATHSWLKMLWEKLSMFGLEVYINDLGIAFPRRGDKFLNQVFEELGFTWEERLILNRVRIYMQVLFLSDVLTASGGKIEPDMLDPRPPNQKWSTYARWPKEKPTPSDFDLWRRALSSICPSNSNSMGTTVGEFMSPTHRIWRWKWCPISKELLNLSPNVLRMDVYKLDGNSNRFTLATHDVPVEDRGILCSVQLVAPGSYRIVSKAHEAKPQPNPSTFIEVLKEWGCMWLWKEMSITGGLDWLESAIAEGTLLAVTDGSYIRELHPHLCSAAFILECTKGRGQIVGHLSEATLAANAYRGELLGLMAIHLLLLSVNRVNATLRGEVDIISDCLGALNRVSYLPPYRIPSRCNCKHSDILKNILVNCRDMSFTLRYSHVKAHQDDNADFASLSRTSQLNCICDGIAKEAVRSQATAAPSKAKPFPLEPICMFVKGEKMTSDTSAHIRFTASRQMARDYFQKKGILSRRSFEEVDWASVHETLHSVPKMFQLWAAKQVLEIAGTMKFLSYQDQRSPVCPSCKSCTEDCAHIIQCEEKGRTEAFGAAADQVECWMRANHTWRELAALLARYIRGRGRLSCVECAQGLPPCFTVLAKSQDLIGWRRFMEGMVSRHLIELQRNYLGCIGSRRCAKKWIRGLVTQLLQATHSQWIYRNVVVHDNTTGTLITEHKLELLKEIDRQKELGAEGLLEEDKYLLEINHDELVRSNGEREEYWLLAIHAARKACLLSRQANQQQSVTV